MGCIFGLQDSIRVCVCVVCLDHVAAGEVLQCVHDSEASDPIALPFISNGLHVWAAGFHSCMCICHVLGSCGYW